MLRLAGCVSLLVNFLFPFAGRVNSFLFALCLPHASYSLYQATTLMAKDEEAEKAAACRVRTLQWLESEKRVSRRSS